MWAYRYISIEGNIGAGKTTLAHRLAQSMEAKLLLEHFAENSFLPKFYEDPDRFAFPLEMSFMADRFKQIQDEFQAYNLFGDRIVSDYIFAKSLLFAANNLKTDEYELYRRIFHLIHAQLPQPELILFLYAPVPVLLENIRKRGRPYEQQIQADYLERIQERYTDYLRSHEQSPVLMIDSSKINFVSNEEHYQWICSLLKQPYEKGIFYPEYS